MYKMTEFTYRGWGRRYYYCVENIVLFHVRWYLLIQTDRIGIAYVLLPVIRICHFVSSIQNVLVVFLLMIYQHWIKVNKQDPWPLFPQLLKARLTRAYPRRTWASATCLRCQTASSTAAPATPSHWCTFVSTLCAYFNVKRLNRVAFGIHT
jgi:hypothetical protein